MEIWLFGNKYWICKYKLVLFVRLLLVIRKANVEQDNGTTSKNNETIQQFDSTLSNYERLSPKADGIFSDKIKKKNSAQDETIVNEFECVMALCLVMLEIANDTTNTVSPIGMC